MKFFRCSYVKEDGFEEHMKKYGLKMIGEYIKIAEHNGIATSLRKTENYGITAESSEDHSQEAEQDLESNICDEMTM